jgi:hypothetical protein
MTEPLASPVPSPVPIEPEKPGGFLQNLLDVYFEPRAAFTRIAGRPAFLVPLALAVCLGLAFFGVWIQKVDAREFMQTQIEEGPFADRIPAERRAEIVEQQAAGLAKWGWINVAVFTPLMIVVCGAVLLFVYRFFYASEVTFKQALAVTAWVFLAVGLVTQPLTLVVMALKGDWNINPQDALQANLGLLLDRSTAAGPLWALFTSIDLFSLWMVFLLAVGFGVASRKTTAAALWGVGACWALIVLVKVGWAAMF